MVSIGATAAAGQTLNLSRSLRPAGPASFYQLALCRPGTSPRMAASRSLLRASPNLR